MTSLTVSEFDALVPTFIAESAKLHSLTHTRAGKPRCRKASGGNKARLAPPEDQLLFILIYQKTYPLQTAHGLQFDLSQAQTNEWIHRLLPILERSLTGLKQMPERDGAEFATSGVTPGVPTDLIIDGTDRRAHRRDDTDSFVVRDRPLPFALSHLQARADYRRKETRVRFTCGDATMQPPFNLVNQPETFEKFAQVEKMLFKG